MPFYILEAHKKHYEKFADGSAQEIDVPYDIPDSWEWVRLNDITSYIQRGKSPKYSNIPIYPVIAQKCNQWSGFSIDLARFIDPETVHSYQKERLLRDGDLMWNSTGLGTLGRLAIYHENKNPYGWAVADSHVTVIRVLSGFINCHFIYNFLSSPIVQSVIEEKASGSTKQKELLTKTIKEYLIPLPPLAEQQRIVEAIESALERVDEYAKSYNRLEQLDKEFPDKLKKSILQYAMQGKLVEQDPNDESVEVLLEKIRAEKQKLFEEGKIKKKDLEISIVSQGDDNSYYGKIPMNWVQTTLNYIGIISTGNTPSKNSPENYGGEIPFYKPADLLQGELYNATEYLSVLGNKKSRKIKAGSILINGIGNIGIAGIVRVDGAFNQQMHGIEVFNFVNSKFLLLAIQSDFMQKQFKNNTSSTTIPILNKTRFSQTIINFPGIRTQKLIITKAEKLFEKVNQF